MLHPLIQVTHNDVIEGKGLVSTGFIAKGEVVSRLEPNQRTYRIDYILGLSDEQQDAYMHYCYQCDEENVVCEDGDEKYMNHSCDPNTWWLDDETMIARRDIQPGEELTYDYATTDVDIPFEMSCQCGSENCRGMIRHTDYLLPEWQTQYGNYLPKHVLAAVQKSIIAEGKGKNS